MIPSTATPLWRTEAAGAVADLGVLVPIAVSLVVLNGLSPTSVLLPAGLLYLLVARLYRLPIAVQPLKAFGAIAIAAGAGPSVIAAGALLMGGVFVVLGATGLIDAAARFVPESVIRGVQLTVAVLLLKVAYGLVTNPPKSFTAQPPAPALTAVALLAALWFLRGRVALLIVAAGMAFAIRQGLDTGAAFGVGPSAFQLPTFTVADFATAATLLVIPQLPLTFANSCLAPVDAARTYFGSAAARVTAGRLAMSLGVANLFAGGIAGMPVCHGAGGLSAHYAFGARTWRAPAIMGGALVVVALAFGDTVAGLLPMFPIAILAALLGVAAITHVQLLRDVRGTMNWVVVLVVAGLGVFANLAYGVLAGILVAKMRRSATR